MVQLQIQDGLPPKIFFWMSTLMMPHIIKLWKGLHSHNEALWGGQDWLSKLVQKWLKREREGDWFRGFLVVGGGTEVTVLLHKLELSCLLQRKEHPGFTSSLIKQTRNRRGKERNKTQRYHKSNIQKWSQILFHNSVLIDSCLRHVIISLYF